MQSMSKRIQLQVYHFYNHKDFDMVHKINRILEVGNKISKTSGYVHPKLEMFISRKTSYPTQSPCHTECTRSIAEHIV